MHGNAPADTKRSLMTYPVTAVIGGSGLTQLCDLQITEQDVVNTPYGEPSGPLLSGKLGDQNIAFLARHGHGHSIAPHKVNYRANIWALKEKGIRTIIAVGAVGTINTEFADGSLVIPDQLIDYTHSRSHTFFDGESNSLKHVDFTHPYTPKLRQVLIDCAAENAINVHDQATYAVTQGPRLETAAEIQKYKRDGADLVGMTSMPEAALAREAGMHYVLIALVVNAAAGLQSNPISIEQVMQTLEQNKSKVIELISYSLSRINQLEAIS